MSYLWDAPGGPIGQMPGCGAAAGAPRRREDVRGLGRRHHPDLRPRTGEITPASFFVAVLGASTLHLCACHAQPGSGELDRLPRASLRILSGHTKTCSSPTTRAPVSIAPAATSPI